MKRTTTLFFLALALTACPKDEDADGFKSDEDCDDQDEYIYPGAIETCDEVDNDCDGTVDEDAVDAITFYADGDGDGHGEPDETTQSCEQPEGYVHDGDDCDDDVATTYPGADELCDHVDNDCDNQVDEGLAQTWYADTDGDGYGDPYSSINECDPGGGYVSNDEDCDDSDDQVHPGATEHCDDVDEDCDGSIDEGAVDMGTWFADSDGDGLGDAYSSFTACDQPGGTVSNTDDCNDDFDFITVCDTVYEVQDGTLAEDTAVVFNEVLVTAISRYGFWAQEPAGGEYSGVYVYMGSKPSLSVGDSVAVSGTTLEYYELTEVSWASGTDFLETLSTGGTVTAAVVDTADLAHADDAEPWEGVLIEVQDVEVTNEDLGYGEWEIDSAVRVDDLIYDAADDYTITNGTTFSSITGPLTYSYDVFKIVPRDASDVMP